MNFNISPIAFYPSRAAQQWRSAFYQRNIAVVTGEDLPPFIINDTPTTAPDTIEIYDPNTDTLINTVSATDILAHTSTVNGVSVNSWIYQGTSAGIWGFSTPGYYYLKIGNYYSDILKFGPVNGDYVKLTYQFFDDIITPDGTLISKYIVYKQIFETDLWHPTYEINEEGKENAGIFYAMQQITKKTCGFSEIVNEAQLDTLNLTRMADNVQIEARTNGVIRNFSTNTFEIKSKWESDDVASIEVTFDLFNIVMKCQQTNVAPEPLPIPTPPEPQTTYKIRGTTIAGVNSVDFVVAYVGETFKVETVPVVSGQFVFGYNKKLTAFSTGDNHGLHGSTTELKTIDFRESCLLSAATSFSLRNCSNLESANFGTAKMEYVESLSWMFYNCKKLQSVSMPDVTFGANLLNINYQDQMFSGCESLTSISMPKAVIAGPSGTTFASMFRYCGNLTTINMPLATFAGGVDFSHMFEGCEKLTTITMTAATFANATNMNNAFYGIGVSTFNIGAIFPALAAHPTSVENICMNAKSTSIDLSALDLSNITSLKSAFESCKNATTITFDISDVSSVTNWKSTFKHCESMTNISTLFASFTFANATNVNETFAYTSENISLPAATFAAATNATGLFSYSTATSISIPAATFVAYDRDYANICEYANNLTTFDMQSAVFGAIPTGHIYSWFYGCPALTSINLNAVCTQSQVYLLVYSLVIDAATVSKMIKFVQNNNSTISIYQSAYDNFSPAEQTQIQSDLTTYAVSLDFA